MAVLGSTSMVKGSWNPSKEALSRTPAHAVFKLGMDMCVCAHTQAWEGKGAGRGRGSRFQFQKKDGFLFQTATLLPNQPCWWGRALHSTADSPPALPLHPTYTHTHSFSLQAALTCSLISAEMRQKNSVPIKQQEPRRGVWFWDSLRNLGHTPSLHLSLSKWEIWIRWFQRSLLALTNSPLLMSWKVLWWHRRAGDSDSYESECKFWLKFFLAGRS